MDVLAEEHECLWIHDGNSRRPHALLTSGNHSNGFFNATGIIGNPEVLGMVCSDLAEKLLEADDGVHDAYMVFGSAMGAVTLAYQMAAHM
ncbi:MAG: hypothetical protein DRO99_04435, partial [Candidatus Aenigmatarchaeota archaeon]